MSVSSKPGARVGEKSALLRLLAQYSPLVIFAMLCTALAIIEPNFRTPNNLSTVAERTCVVGIIAIGETLIIIAGGIDLSVGSVAALSGVVGALAMTSWGLPMSLGVALGAGTGLFCGFINGFLSTKGRLPAFIATLGMMMAARGAAMLLTDGQNVYRLPNSLRFFGGTYQFPEWLQFPKSFAFFGKTYLLPEWLRFLSDNEGRLIPLSITVAIALVFAITLTFTRYGRALYATGGNAVGARLSGVPVDRVRIIAFSLAGLLTGFAGMMLAARTNIGDPKAAEGMELDAIAACVIGGASLMGGEGGMLGSLAGALIMNVLVNFFTLSDYDVYWQNVLIGGLIIGLVFYDTLRKRRAGLIKDI